MNFRSISFLLVLFLPAWVAAQDSLRTQELEEVVVHSDILGTYARGSKLRTLEYADGKNLAQGLQTITPAYMKDLGAPGQASTISFRGTGAGHTAVFWNGININSLTLGQTDFSLIPIFASETVNILYGSGAALLGSDAIGGSINLSTQPRWTYGHELSLGMEFGSFGQQHYRLKMHSGNSKWQNSVKVYYQSADNDFDVDYRDTTYAQNNASIENFGILSHTEYRLTNHQSLSLDVWYNQMDRLLQPKVGDFSNEDELKDEGLRTILNYYLSGDRFDLNLKAGWTRDKQLYNQTSETGTRRFIAGFEFDRSFGEKLDFHAGMNLQRIFSDVDSYEKDVQETRTDAYASITFTPYEFIDLGLNLRQTLVEEFDSPFTPSIGTEIKLLNSTDHKLLVKGVVSRHYKVPTFNDRYWDPGGNPDLNAEKAGAGNRSGT